MKVAGKETLPRRTPEKEKKEAAPLTRVKSGGKVSQRLRILADLYLKNHSGQSVRWVYSPLHKPELSNVVSRQIDGFELVYVRDLGEDTVALLPGMKSEEPVRVGDTIMMAIAEDIRQGLQGLNDQAAADEADRVEEEFYGAIEDVKLEKGMKPEYQPRPLGSSVTELMEREVEGPESHKET